MTEGRFAEAATLWMGLVRAQPGNVGLRLNLGLALHGAGRWAEAAAQLERVLAERPGTGGAPLVLGRCYNRLNQPLKALPLLEGVVRSEPLNEDAQFELATAYGGAGRHGQAIDLLQPLAGRDPSNPRMWHGLLMNYLALERPEGAPAHGFEAPAAAREDCEDPSPACHLAHGEYWQIVQAMAKRDGPEAAWWRKRALDALIERALKELVEIPSPDTFELLAEVYDAQGRWAEAAGQWRAALDLSPDDERLKKALERSVARARGR